MIRKNEKVEDFFYDLKKILESFPNFVACYLAGSYAYGYYLDGVSDLDITLIFNTVDYEKEKEDIEKMISMYDLEIDLCYFSQKYIFENQDSNDIRSVWCSKIANYLICGEDVLKNFILPSPKEYTKYTLINTLKELKELEKTNLAHNNEKYLEIDDSVKQFVTLRNGEPCIKQMLVVCTWIASTLLANDFAIYTANKDYTIKQYKMRYDDGEYMYELLNMCKYRWKYKVPTEKEDLKKLAEYGKYLINKKNQLLNKFSNIR